MRVLGIETSCDETGIAIYDSQEGLIAHELYSQAEQHALYGGVVPELAARDHLKKLVPLIQACGSVYRDIDAIAYTAGPGLAGPLRTGAAVAHTLAYRLKKPLLPVHHLEAHLMAAFMEPYAEIPFPFIGLLVSGGHTILLKAEALGQYQVIGQTLDDAAGEAFDKAAKLLGLPYPGGAALSILASQGQYKAARLPLPYPKTLNFSFSGLKTAFRLQAERIRTKQDAADLAHAFEDNVISVLVNKSLRCLNEFKVKTLVAAGGVLANEKLRMALQAALIRNKSKLYTPAPQFSTDNGAMVAFTGWLHLQARPERVNEYRLPEAISIFPKWTLGVEQL